MTTPASKECQEMNNFYLYPVYFDYLIKNVSGFAKISFGTVRIVETVKKLLETDFTDIDANKINAAIVATNRSIETSASLWIQWTISKDAFKIRSLAAEEIIEESFKKIFPLFKRLVIMGFSKKS